MSDNQLLNRVLTAQAQTPRITDNGPPPIGSFDGRMLEVTDLEVMLALTKRELAGEHLVGEDSRALSLLRKASTVVAIVEVVPETLYDAGWRIEVASLSEADREWLTAYVEGFSR